MDVRKKNIIFERMQSIKTLFASLCSCTRPMIDSKRKFASTVRKLPMAKKTSNRPNALGSYKRVKNRSAKKAMTWLIAEPRKSTDAFFKKLAGMILYSIFATFISSTPNILIQKKTCSQNSLLFLTGMKTLFQKNLKNALIFFSTSER